MFNLYLNFLIHCAIGHNDLPVGIIRVNSFHGIDHLHAEGRVHDGVLARPDFELDAQIVPFARGSVDFAENGLGQNDCVELGLYAFGNILDCFNDGALFGFLGDLNVRIRQNAAVRETADVDDVSVGNENVLVIKVGDFRIAQANSVNAPDDTVHQIHDIADVHGV